MQPRGAGKFGVRRRRKIGVISQPISETAVAAAGNATSLPPMIAAGTASEGHPGAQALKNGTPGFAVVQALAGPPRAATAVESRGRRPGLGTGDRRTISPPWRQHMPVS